ncbi:hypothetical protein [Streptomyces sp. WM6378]|nr:hypothetical protein [Streptomyces sp. WM6378]
MPSRETGAVGQQLPAVRRGLVRHGDKARGKQHDTDRHQQTE